MTSKAIATRRIPDPEGAPKRQARSRKSLKVSLALGRHRALYPMRNVGLEDRMTVDAEEWLEDWVEENLNSPGYVESKSEMRESAKACAAQAEAAGNSIANLKAAAGNDLEEYLLRQQNAGTDGEVDRLASKNDDVVRRPIRLLSDKSSG